MARLGSGVLLVDDEPAVRAMLRRWLAGEDIVVCAEATTGEEALAAAQLHRPAAIVLDHQLPDTLGAQLLPRLRQLCPDARIVLFTADQATARAVQISGQATGLIKGGRLAELARALTAPAADAQPALPRPQQRRVLPCDAGRPPKPLLDHAPGPSRTARRSPTAAV